MAKGFYFLKNSVYYGEYDEDQVSGRLLVSAVKPEQLCTNHPLSGSEWAALLWDNHSLLEPEKEDLRAALSEMSLFLTLDTKRSADFSAVEERLGVTLPEELKTVYSAMPDGSVYFMGDERFLPPDELYVEGGNIVFYKKKRTPLAGYDTKSGCLSRYFKKEWSTDPGDVCCYQFCAGRIFTTALMNKPAQRKGRLKGKLVTTLDTKKELEGVCAGKYRLLTGLDIPGTAAMYSDDGALAWIRGNGFYADIHAGAPDEAALDLLGNLFDDLSWK